MNNNKGQSLIEVVFAIGIILLVISGISALMLTSINSRTKGYERNKAVELSQVVMEKLIAQKNANAVEFWNLSSSLWVTTTGITKTDSSYPGYTYIVSPSQYSQNGCSNTTLECMNVVVNVGWSGGTGESFNRFFSRK